MRQDVYRLIDQVLETGIPLEIERKGRRVRLVADEPPGRLDRIRGSSEVVVGDPQDLVSIDWSETWEPDLDAGS